MLPMRQSSPHPVQKEEDKNQLTLLPRETTVPRSSTSSWSGSRRRDCDPTAPPRALP